MKVLVFGGTRFLGRHIVEALSAFDHRVVAFHRGQSTCDLPNNVEERFGDRNADLSAISKEPWDAIVDVNCYAPAQMQRSLELRTNAYLMVSSVNAYSDLSVNGVTETAPTIESFDPEDESLRYGGDKAACERLLFELYPQSSTILRPGLIVGKWDYTGRFTYWCERMLRGGRVLAAAPADRPIQFIDAADIACFVERALSKGINGAFNIVGPAQRTAFQDVVSACSAVAQERGAPPSEIVWADETFLLENGVQPWTELPLWLPDPQWSGVLEIDNSKALSAGLTTRPTAQTIRAILDWTAETGAHFGTGLTAERESELLGRYEALHSAALQETT